MKQKILVVDDEPDIRDLLKDILDDEGYEVEVAKDGQSARHLFDYFLPDLILLDIWMPDIDGITLLKEWKIDPNSNVSVVMMSGHGTVETAMEATKFGAQDFLEKPISMAKLLSTVSNHLKEQVGSVNNEVRDVHFERLIGSSSLIKNLREEVEKAAASDHPLFVMGENGVGKHVLAAHVASCSKGINKIEWIMPSNFYLPSVNENNCVYFVADFADFTSQQLKQVADYFMENELLHQQRNLKFVLATRYEYDIFAQKVAAFPFLRDSWLLPIKVPLLNEHKEDIPELLEYYANWISETEDLPYRHFNVATQNRLRNHDWRGNLSELKVMIRKLLSMNNELDIDIQEIASLLQVIDRRTPISEGLPEHMFLINLDHDLKTSREHFERQYLELQLDKSQGKMSELAKRSGQDRTYLYRKIKALGIQTKK